MADVHEGSSPEASSVREGQRTYKIVGAGEDHGQKVIVPGNARNRAKPAGSRS